MTINNDNGTITAFPLSWPAGWKRTASDNRKRATFGRQGTPSEYGYRRKQELTIAVATERVLTEMRGFGVAGSNTIISTNLKIRLDGLPYSDQKAPSDPGAAVYWRRNQNESQRCMAIDQYDRVADNLAAIAATLNAMRAIERHGGAEILNRAFEGFAALPAAGGSSGVSWWSVLGVEPRATTEEIKQAYRHMVKAHHPDVNGGDGETFIVIQKAYEQAQKEIGFS